MKNLRLIIFILIALAQLAVPVITVWGRIQTLKLGRVWKFKAAPADPEDPIRGRYVALRFSAEEFPQPSALLTSGPVYALLRESPDGFAEIYQISATPVRGDNVVRVRPVGFWSGNQRVAFPFDQLWLSEKAAPNAEQAYRENSRRGKENAYVTVRVRDGDAALEQLYINNQPLHDYLRAQAAKK